MGLIVTPEIVRRLVQIHVRRYQTFIDRANAGQAGYRLSECRDLLDIWKRVEKVQDTPARIDEHGRHEIQDAIDSGGELADVDPPDDGAYDFGGGGGAE